ncbi:MAG: F0F1 ATP synthase subunit B [Actinomycetia bacterium]|nr:F0F1 ATP synthase subunit B [Actinomycetes bacterium]
MTAIGYLASSEPNPLGITWAELILVLVVFGLLFWIIAKFVGPRFEQTFKARRDAIEGGIERAEAAQRDAQAALEGYQRQLADARGEAAQIREAARAEAQQIVEEVRAQAQAEAGRIVARGEEQLSSQRAQVVRELRTEIGSLAVRLAERVVGERLADEAGVWATVDAFLADLESQQSAGSTP